jgi:hypothetical protein
MDKLQASWSERLARVRKSARNLGFYKKILFYTDLKSIAQQQTTIVVFIIIDQKKSHKKSKLLLIFAAWPKL